MVFSWSEPRIIAPSNISDHAPIDISFLKLLWIPDTYFLNLKSIKILDGVHNANGIFLLNKTNILYEIEMEIEVFCNMSFESYPFDSHSCFFMMTSFKHEFNVLNFSLTEFDFDASTQVGRLDYMVEIESLPESMKLRKFKSNGRRFAYAGCAVKLKRYVQKYILNYFMPSGLLVLVSWVSTSYFFKLNFSEFKKGVKLTFLDQLCHTTRTNSWKNCLAYYSFFMPHQYVCIHYFKNS